MLSGNEIDIIDLAFVRMQKEMTKRKILALHKQKYNYWQGKNGRWNSYLPDGKLISSKHESKVIDQIAEYYNAQVEEDIGPSFRDIYFQWREIKDLELVANSIQKYDGEYRRFFKYTDFEELSINEITENTIRKFILESIRDKKLGKEPTKRLYGHIVNVMRYARMERIIPENPAEFLERKMFTKHCIEEEVIAEDQIYSNIELQKIKSALGDLYGDTPDYMPRYTIELAILTGMRPGEIAALKWSDITDEYINITKSMKEDRIKNITYIGKTKTNKSRRFPMCAEIQKLLDRVRVVSTGEYIFNTTSRHISDCMRRVCKYAGVHSGGITALRKTINSNLKRSGVPITIVTSILGHTEEVNERYYTYDTSNMDEKRRIIEKFNRIQVDSIASYK